MDFTELYKQTGNLNKFSPNGLYIATAVHYRLVVRDADSLQILSLFQATDTINDIAWSPDSELISSVSYKSGTLEIWHLKNDKWTGKIVDGVLGFSRVVWAPDSRHLLTFSPLNVSMDTTYSLDKMHSMVFGDKRGEYHQFAKIF
jgi:WD40 repeat protein